MTQGIDPYRSVLVIALGFLGIGYLFDLGWASDVVIVFALLCALSRWVADTVVTGWMKFGAVLGWINTRILLSAIFFLVLTPVALLVRIVTRRDSLMLRATSSTFIERKHQYTPDDLMESW